MKAEDLERILSRRPIVRLSAAEWEALAPAFDEVEHHHTVVAGSLVIIRVGGTLAAVEQPRAEERVVRRLDDEAAMRAFVHERLETYERMWDGCGCKVDYYA
jgi:predicted aminopeptidase